MTLESNPKSKSLFKKLIKNPFAWLAFFILLHAFIGFVIVPLVIKTQILDLIKNQYKREAKIESVSFNPYTISLSIEGFTLYDKDKSVFLSWDELYIDVSFFPLVKKRFELDKVRLTNPNLVIKKLSETEYNFSDLLGEQPKTSKKRVNSNQTSHRKNVTYSALGFQTELAAQTKNKKEKEEKWDFLVNQILIEKLDFTFEDRSLDSLVKINIDDANLIVTHLRPQTKDVSSFSLNLKMRAGGNAKASGKFVLEPMSADINLNVQKINFKQTGPYLAQFAYLRLDDGKLSITGDLKFKMDKKNEMPNITFLGNAGIEDLVLFDTKEKERFLECKAISTVEISARTNPIAVAIGEINLQELYTRIAVKEDKSFNVSKVFKFNVKDSLSVPDTVKAKAISDFSKLGAGEFTYTFTKSQNLFTSRTDTAQANTAVKANFNFDIGRIRVKNSEMFFSDFSLPLKFAAKIHKLNGEIMGVSYGNPLGAAVDLEGTVDEYGLARIKGNIDPFDPISYSDIKMNFNNIELTSLSPYSAKFMGYMVEKGKLTLDIEYLIEKGILTSNNKIFLNKLELGEEVETEEGGLGIPVKLVIALLKDGDGNIDLDLEVEGDLNNPEMDTGKLAWWAVKRVLTTIVTAPFRFLGNLLGFNGDDLEYIDFDPGESKLLPNQFEQLEKLSKALNEKPGISLEIYGAVDTVTDANAIRTKKLNNEFTKRMTTAAKDTLMDPMKLEANISRKILETMYKEYYDDSTLANLKNKYSPKSESENPDSLSSKTFDLRNYLKEMISDLTVAQPVSQEEFTNLVNSRVEAIKNHMLTTHSIQPERIAIEETEIYELEDRNWVKCRLGIGTFETAEK